MLVAGRQQDRVAWAVAEAAVPGELQSGDRCLIRPSASGMLIAVVDGTGHGAAAAAAARIAIATLEAHVFETPLALLVRCHEELKGTRGAVMTIAYVDHHDQTLTWLGVGNVEALLFHGRERAQPDRALLRNGVVGYQLPAMRADVVPLQPSDTLIIVTDGITPEFSDAVVLHDDPQRIAVDILEKYRKRHDDALVVVARYLGVERATPPA
jgi:serine phosphatase RsbU (regulator of sigma subunit)